MSVGSQSSEISSQTSHWRRETARKSTTKPAQHADIYLHVPRTVSNTSRKSTARPSPPDVNRIHPSRQGRPVLGVRHRNIPEESDTDSHSEEDNPPAAQAVGTPVLSQASTDHDDEDENNPQLLRAAQRSQPIHVSPNTSSGYSSRRSSQSLAASSKPDPLVLMNKRVRRRINQRYEAAAAPLGGRERRAGRGKDERLLRKALQRKRRSDQSEWRRLRVHLRDDDVRCPKTDIPLAPFVRLVRELAVKECSDRGFDGTVKFQHAALLAIRDATEGFMVNMFEQCSLFIAHAGRVTLMNKDIFLARRLWNGSGEAKSDDNN